MVLWRFLRYRQLASSFFGLSRPKICAVQAQRVVRIATSAQRKANVAHISSTSNQTVKHLCKLRTSAAHRQAHQSVLVVGLALLLELATEVTDLQIKILLWGESGSQVPDSLHPEGVYTVTENVLKKTSGVNSAEGLKAVAEVAMPSQDVDFCTSQYTALSRLLVLDGIQDPGNMGTLLRTALALGWHGTYFLPGCCDPFNEKALRASRGAVFKIPISFGDWQKLEQVLAAHKLDPLAAQPQSDAEEGKGSVVGKEGREIEEMLEGSRLALILGSEGQGLSVASQQRSKAVSIPMAGNMESLSVSQAGAILMFALGKGLPTLQTSLRRILRNSAEPI